MEPHATQTRPSSAPTARVIAVFALVVAVVLVVIVIAGSVGGSGTPSTTARSAGSSASGPQDEYYVVQPGDTFGGIAQKEGVPIGRLQELNPNLDPQLLPEKGCVDLVPNGCKVLANGG
jgi:LysM repeat protein